ncbi:XdhC family protein [Paraburkholderia caribensis]|uniref:XdhC family protein n=1 Tax=Paraburkholderia caribensis TaxID=75105 RepID=UPI0034D1AC75
MNWTRAGFCVVLATVVHTWGSAPRPIGALLAIRSDGAMKGSVSGGCIEDDLADRAREGMLATHGPQLLRYGVTADEAHRFGIPCGGTLEIVLERIHAGSLLSDVLEQINEGRTVMRTLDVSTGKTSLQHVETPAQFSFDGRFLNSPYGPQLRAILIGAGQLSEYVAQFCVALGYRVIVCDPRDEYERVWNVPRTEFTREMPDDLLLRIGLNGNTAVLALTHDPKLDDLALLEALKSKAFYIGAIGSRVNSFRRKERLRLFDLTNEQIDRLHAPIGLYVGAQTPPEIAVSIVAEMLAEQRNVPVVQKHSMRNISRITHTVAEVA